MLDEQTSTNALWLKKIEQVQRALLERMGKMQLSTEEMRDLLVPLQGLLDLLERPNDQEAELGMRLAETLGQIVLAMRQLDLRQSQSIQTLEAVTDRLLAVETAMITLSASIGPLVQMLALEEPYSEHD